ncbi:hypothetical protein IEQ34_022435 [Dendrobium chrysotoxum]|uniref:Uncharacterized protein n=1 Tax=Dendrobium chrysotoxum TaxID=161865 RepID=A0AAV7FK42_DENCH|nr:hypothetical protein IEQ34_022435 [Dendrobium chrysotoxum]
MCWPIQLSLENDFFSFQVREMPNVIILPRSADYSEEAWMEVREKAICMLQSFLLDGVIPNNDVSDEDEEKSDIAYDEQSEKQVMENPLIFDAEQRIDVSQFNAGYNQKVGISQLKESQVSVLSQNIASRSEGKNNSYGKKGKKRSARQRSQRKSDDFSGVDSCYSSHQDDDTATSTREQSSRFTFPEDSKNKQVCLLEPNVESVDKPVTVTKGLGMKSVEILKDGFVIALHARDHPGFHVSRQRVPGAGWFLDTISSITKKDPAAQFLVSFRSKEIHLNNHCIPFCIYSLQDTVGLRSLAAGGKLLQINRRMEFVFASYNFDVWESWKLEGYLLEECRLVNCRNPLGVVEPAKARGKVGVVLVFGYGGRGGRENACVSTWGRTEKRSGVAMDFSMREEEGLHILIKSRVVGSSSVFSSYEDIGTVVFVNRQCWMCTLRFLQLWVKRMGFLDGLTNLSSKICHVSAKVYLFVVWIHLKFCCGISSFECLQGNCSSYFMFKFQKSFSLFKVALHMLLVNFFCPSSVFYGNFTADCISCIL